MHLESIIFGSVTTFLFVWSLFHWNVTTLVAGLLFTGWSMAQIAQWMGQNIPLEVYLIADFASGMILLSYVLIFLHRRQVWMRWVWVIGTIYGFMILGHAAFVGIKIGNIQILPQINSNQYYWYLTALFGLQLLITGWQIYRDRRTVVRGNHYSRRRIPNLLHGHKGMGRSK